MKKITVPLTSLGLTILSAVPVFAQEQVVVDQPDQLKFTSLGALISNVLSLVLMIAVFLAAVYLIWGAFQWLTSGGDKAAVDAARQRIQTAIIGLVILFAVFFVAQLMGTFFGINPWNFTVPAPK